jgi:hypothetical protein
VVLHQVTGQGWGNDGVATRTRTPHASLLVVEPAEQQELSEAFSRDTSRRPGIEGMPQYPWPVRPLRTPTLDDSDRRAVSSLSQR